MSIENIGKEEQGAVLQEENEKPSEIRVAITSDYLRAKISVEINDPAHRLTKEELMEALRLKNVSFGIQTRVIDEIVSKNEPVYELEIAHGIPIVNGENGKINYNFDISKTNKPTINDDGSVDFKNTNFLLPVKKGEVLATRSMPTEGSDGTLVTGKQMRSRPGKMVNFKVGKNVAVSEDGLSIFAECDGSIKVEGDKISVMHFLEIQSDVGIATGNIEFAGEVIIHGNVRSGYSVKATGDITIYGLVESAVVETEKNLTINLGVQGNEHAQLKVGGDLVAKFINSSSVDCRGNVYVDSIMHSDLICNGNVLAEGKNGLIIGGKIISKRNVEAKCIGSRMGTTTFVNVGVSPDTIKNYKDLEDERNRIQDDIAKVDKVLKLIEAKGRDNMTAENRSICERSLDLRKEHEEKLIRIEKKMEELSIFIRYIGKSYIKTGDIFPGARLKIDNFYYTVKERFLDVKFHRGKDEVIMSALED